MKFERSSCRLPVAPACSTKKEKTLYLIDQSMSFFINFEVTSPIKFARGTSNSIGILPSNTLSLSLAVSECHQ